MADITTPQVVTFANNRTRVLADKIASLYYALTAYQNDYASQGIAALITAGGTSNFIGDGSDVDGRQRITGTQMANFKAGVDAMVTALGTTNITGVGTPMSTIVNGIQVNGSPR